MEEDPAALALAYLLQAAAEKRARLELLQAEIAVRRDELDRMLGEEQGLLEAVDRFV